ncbi:MAG: hypothetical protein IIW52_04015 [Alistipes sp.]|nr:hypothetical protein [Alistipes sp.]
MIRISVLRVWQYISVALFLLLLSSCGSDVSNDPKAVDTITTQYISCTLKSTIERCDTSVEEVNRIKLTRQDNIPIALVDYTARNGEQKRDIYYFDYQMLLRVRELLKKEMTVEDIAKSLNVSTVHATAMVDIMHRCTGH